MVPLMVIIRVSRQGNRFPFTTRPRPGRKAPGDLVVGLAALDRWARSPTSQKRHNEQNQEHYEEDPSDLRRDRLDLEQPHGPCDQCDHQENQCPSQHGNSPLTSSAASRVTNRNRSRRRQAERERGVFGSNRPHHAQSSSQRNRCTLLLRLSTPEPGPWRAQCPPQPATQPLWPSYWPPVRTLQSQPQPFPSRAGRYVCGISAEGLSRNCHAECSLSISPIGCSANGRLFTLWHGRNIRLGFTESNFKKCEVRFDQRALSRFSGRPLRRSRKPGPRFDQQRDHQDSAAASALAPSCRLRPSSCSDTT